MKMKSSRVIGVWLAASAMVLVLSSTANATVVSGQSSAYGVKSTVDVLNTLSLQLGPLPQSSGTAPPPYDENNALSAINASVGGASLSTGLLTTAASSNVDGASGNRFARASAAVNTLDLSVRNIFFPLIDFSADTITSSAMASGDSGALTATGSSSLENANVKLVGLINTSLSASAAPNTDVLPGLLDPLGIDLLLNEQIFGGDGVNSRSVEVNAIHLSFDEFDLSRLGLSGLSGLNGILNGDLILSHSYAQLAAVPTAQSVDAPSHSALFMLLGVAMIGGIVWGRRQGVC